MPTISVSREYSTSKNIKVYLLSIANECGNIQESALPTNFANLSSYPTSATSKIKYYLNKIPNLQEIPDLSTDATGDRDTVEITTLEDEYHEFADGLKNRNTDSNTLSFTFLYDGACYDAIRTEAKRMNDEFNAGDGKGIVSNATVYYPRYFHVMFIVLPDGSVFAFRVKDITSTLAGAGVSAALTYTLNCSVEGDMEFYYPTSGAVNVFQYAGQFDGKSASVKLVGDTATGSDPVSWGNVSAT